MGQKLLQKQLKELGSKLETYPASKDALVKLLEEGVTCLSELDQSPPKSVMESMQPFLNAIAKPELLKHQDREVRLFVAASICEITRITAPEPPYDDDILKDTFQLIVSTFSGLSDPNSPSFGRRVVILETLARYRSCVVMLDLECDDLIHEMFNIFFTVARDDHPENVLTSMQTIMEVILEESEDVQENILLTLLSALGHNREDITMAAKRLALNVIEHCAEKLEPGIKQLVVSTMSGENSSLKPDISVLHDIYRCSPQILSGVVPYLTGELLSDELDVRMKAVGLVGDLFALTESTISEAFQPVFVEFLKRLTDRVAEVRLRVLEHVKICLLANPLRPEASQINAALCDRLLDYDENVRKQVVSVFCDVACQALTSIPIETIKLVSERLRDKSLLVKTYTMERLADIYRVSCTNNSTKNDEYDWIVGKILRCFYDKDFRSETIDPILSLSLFPTDFSVKDKVKSWVRVFSGFEKVEVKALEKILEQKQRLQQEMQKYLSLRQLTQEGDGNEIQKKKMLCFHVMSRYFADPAKTEENFHILDQLKDSNIWNALDRLLDPNTSFLLASSSRDDLKKILGQNHRIYEFLSSLTLKYSYLLFDKEHVREILLEAAEHKTSGSSELILSCMTILVILARFCPLLLGGIEEDLVLLLEDDNEIVKEGTLHILAKAGGTIREQLGVSSRSLDLILERICIEGSRRQAKYAVHALASITKDDGLMSLSVLYKRLVDMLEDKSHLPAVLQSLGCIAQAAMPVFETRESEVEKFIKGNILEHKHIPGDKPTDLWDDRSEHCSLKVFGVKTLVKSYLPDKDAQLRSGFDDLIGILKNILSFGDVSREIESSSVDRAHLKLTAAKAILRLSKYWESKIPTDVFYLTLGIWEDNFPELRKLLLSKIHQYVKDRILDPKYACAFVLDISSQQSDLEENKRNLNDIIQMCRQGKGRQISSQTDANSTPVYPEYILPYLVHSLAHHPSFPNMEECKDVKSFEAIYRQLYLFLSMLLHGDADGKSDESISKDKETISFLNSIFRCIKRSEDAYDAAKSKNLYALCDLGLSVVKRLAPQQDVLQDSSVSVTLPPLLYKPLEKKEESVSLVDEEKTWLADESILGHFESLELKANGIVNSVIADDDDMKDSENEGSEMPLGKLMKRLKAKAAKARKDVKNASAPAGVANDNNIDILKMVKEINSDDIGTSNKFKPSNGHEGQRRRSDPKLQKRKMLFSGASNVPVPKRRRTSTAQARKVLPANTEGSERLTSVNQESSIVETNKILKEFQTSSEDKPMKESTAEPTESNLLFSRIREKLSSSSKHKGKRSDRNHGEALSLSPDAKKSKTLIETNSTPSPNLSKSGSVNKQKGKSNSGLVKCATKDNGSSTADLTGCRIKVWWPMDKKYYEGVVKSFDTQKKKHVIVYEDGDVEVLRLDRERWQLVDDGKKAEKQSGSSKGSHPKGRLSGNKRKSVGGSKQDKKLEEKSPSSQVRGKRTQRRGSKQKQKTVLKSESSAESGGSPTHPESTSKTLVDSDSEKEKNKQVDEVLSDEELSEKSMKLEEDAEKGLSEAEDPKEERNDSEETQSDNVGPTPHDAHESDDEAVTSSKEKQPEETYEESEQESDEGDDMGKRPTTDSAAELSDDEPLSAWKLRTGKK